MVDNTNDVFSADGTPKDLIAELVGEGKKFKTVEDLAKGKLQSDIHIARLENEAKDMREKLVAAKSVEDILDAVKANSAIGSNPLNNNENGTQESAPVGLSAEQIAKIVAEQITGRETETHRARNKQKANDLLVGMFGEKAGEIFNAEANTPELRATLTQLAEVSPEKFASFFKRDADKSVIDSGVGSKNVNLLNLNANNGAAEPGTQSFYSKLRKENPKLYYSAKVQLEMHDSALKNPAKYFGRNT